MSSLEFIINLTIIGLLIPTIIYAYRLNKNLNILRENQNSFGKMIDALNDATFKAENSIPKLKSLTMNSSENLKEVVENANVLKEDLIFINQRANSLADRLETVIKENRSPSDTMSSLGKQSSFQSNDFKINDAERSEAEMELLKALRSIK
ncbi:MAG: DUF6468 domain-containing protein [Alphaproteobacteria bacterium]